MKTDLLSNGAGMISPVVQDAVIKSANELHGKKAVMLSLSLTAFPPALAAFKTVQGIDLLVSKACTDALVTLATKGSGCTAELGWYNAGKAKHETSTGALPGSINVANNAVDWFILAAEYMKPN